MAQGRSTSKVWIVCTIVFAVGFIAAGYLNYFQHQRSQDSIRQLNGTITDLRYQLDLDAKAQATLTSPTTLPSVSPSPTPTDAPAVTASPSPSITPAPAPTPATATTTTKQLANLHIAASQSSKVLTRLSAGTTVTLGATVINNYQQVSANGVNGYVLKSYLK